MRQSIGSRVAIPARETAGSLPVGSSLAHDLDSPSTERGFVECAQSLAVLPLLKVTVAVVLAVAWVCARPSDAAAAGCRSPRRYAIVVANNATHDPGLPPLRYADDDAIRYYELFRAAGARTALLVDPDRDTLRRLPEVAQVAMPPTRRQLSETAAELFRQAKADRQNGCESHFYFVYTGHGAVAPNRQGYINLSDGPFHRADLYEQIVEPSPATFNHLIIDSCHAASFVQKKGDRSGNYRDAVEAFVGAQDLADYDNTGFIYANVEGDEALESAPWESGVFSHMLQSALLGPGDVDLDRRITYAEAAGFLGVANVAVREQWGRLKVYFRPPPIRETVSLLDLAEYRPSAWLTVDSAHAGRYSARDARGISVADFHSSAEQAVRLALVGTGPFEVTHANMVAELPDRSQAAVQELLFGPATYAVRGATSGRLEQVYFSFPFGRSIFNQLAKRQR